MQNGGMNSFNQGQPQQGQGNMGQIPGLGVVSQAAHQTGVVPNLPQAANLPVGFALSDVQSALVKWFDPTKNFGFLIIKDGPMQGDEIFVHGIDVIGNPVRDNDTVMCQVQSAPNVKRRCVNVTGGSGVHGDMTRPPKNNSAVLQKAQAEVRGRGALSQADALILGAKIGERKDSRVNYRSLGDLRKQALKKLRKKQRNDSRSSSSSSRSRSRDDRRRNRSRDDRRRGGGGDRGGASSSKANGDGDKGGDKGGSSKRKDSRRRDDSRKRGGRR